MTSTTRHAATAALALLLVGAGHGSHTATPPASAARHSPFVAVLSKHWDAWDADHDGTLSADELDKLVVDPQLTGDDAAAAATLKMVVRNKKLTVPPLTKAYFEQVDAKATAPHGTDEDAANATVDVDRTGAGKAPKWDLLFAAGKHRIKVADAATASWPTADAIGHVRQGPLGDCFFVAVVGAAVHRDPSIVRGLLSSDGRGPVRAKFALASAPVAVTLTDAERAMSSTTGGQGDWLALLEQAYGRYRRQATADGGGSADAGTTEGTDVICHGGTAGPVIAALTGHGSRFMHLPNDLGQRQAAVKDLLPKLRTTIADGLRDGRIVVAGVSAAPKPDADGDKPRPTAATPDAKPDDPQDPTKQTASSTLPSPPNITHGHMYAVVGYDAATDTVAVWNPHGQTFHPKGAAGLANGYDTDHGLFKIPLGEMYQFFSGVSCETATSPSAPKSAGKSSSRGKGK